MFIGHVKYPLFLSNFNRNLTYLTDFQKINVTFLEYPFIGSRVVPCEQMETEWRRSSAIMHSQVA